MIEPFQMSFKFLAGDDILQYRLNGFEDGGDARERLQPADDTRKIRLNSIQQLRVDSQKDIVLLLFHLELLYRLLMHLEKGIEDGESPGYSACISNSPGGDRYGYRRAPFKQVLWNFNH